MAMWQPQGFRLHYTGNEDNLGVYMLLQDKLNIDLNGEQFFKGNLTGQSKENPKTSNSAAVTFQDKKATEIISFVTERIKKVFEQC